MIKVDPSGCKKDGFGHCFAGGRLETAEQGFGLRSNPRQDASWAALQLATLNIWRPEAAELMKAGFFMHDPAPQAVTVKRWQDPRALRISFVPFSTVWI
jgi:hypothetical protein